MVGVYLPRSAELMVSLLGILKAGGAYVVLDPLYPKSRLEYMIEDAGIQFVVTAEGQEGHFARRNGEVRRINGGKRNRTYVK